MSREACIRTGHGVNFCASRLMRMNKEMPFGQRIRGGMVKMDMKRGLLLLLALFLGGGLVGCSTVARDSRASTGTATNSPAKLSQADAIVEEMRGFNMQPGNPRFDDGSVNPTEQRREEIIRQLRLTGDEAVPALIQALKDLDVQMRRNADLVIWWLAWGYDSKPLDMRKAIPALIQATEDKDGMVRAWAASALGEIGPGAKEAVPALIKLVHDPDEGCRNYACIALGDVGPAAKDALPALRKELNDSSKDVRQFAKRAIDKIQI